MKEKQQRIVSFLPAATEMICALGLEENLIGVSHECDYPPPVKSKAVVVRAALELEHLSQNQIDEAVASRMGQGQSLYTVDERLLADLAPDLIVTQDLCQVCAPSGDEVSRALRALTNPPEILYLTPSNIDDIFSNISELGKATGRIRDAQVLVADSCERLKRIRIPVGTPNPRVFCMEWIDPLYCAGHWVPEMVELAGGEDVLGRKGSDSVRVSWQELAKAAPEIVVVMPCGYGLEQSLALASQLKLHPCWKELPAVRQGQVFAVDANAYFARPGPRLVDGVELLAHLIHPELFGPPGPAFAGKVSPLV